MTHSLAPPWTARAAAACALFATLCSAASLPNTWFGRSAQPWLAASQAPQQALARSVNLNLQRVDAGSFTTGSALFDGEWTFGTSVMTAIGNAQLGLTQPQLRTAARQATDRALARTVEPSTRAFDRQRWGADPLEDPNPAHAHVAYLGYLNLALSLRSTLGASEFDALGEGISLRLLERFEATDELLLETYPGEYYPVDNALAIASIALRNRTRELRQATTRNPATLNHTTPDGNSERSARERDVVRRWVERCKQHYVDPQSGLLLQSVPGGTAALANSSDGALPRGSGTALAAFALNYVDSPLGAELQAAAARELLKPVLGFGVLQEYPAQVATTLRSGDIDSGPLVAGYSISASGFMLGASLAYADLSSARSLLATFSLLGGLTARDSEAGVARLSFVSGGPLADAIMLAMLTAPRHDQLQQHLGASLTAALTGAS